MNSNLDLDELDEELNKLFDEILSMALKKKKKLCKEKINKIRMLLDMETFINDDLLIHCYDIFL